MSTVERASAVVADHFDRRWLVWVVGIVALLIGVIIGYVLPSGGAGFGASASLDGVGSSEIRQGGR